jgi:hypothetical protein
MQYNKLGKESICVINGEEYVKLSDVKTAILGCMIYLNDELKLYSRMNYPTINITKLIKINGLLEKEMHISLDALHADSVRRTYKQCLDNIELWLPIVSDANVKV